MKEMRIGASGTGGGCVAMRWLLSCGGDAVQPLDARLPHRHHSARFFARWRIQGDHYGGEWPVKQFRKHGIAYDAAPSHWFGL
jgi:hypothetical protein